MLDDPPKSTAIEKALEILLKFQEEQTSWGIRELASELGFSPATVQRILQTLKAYQFVNQDPDTRQYTLGTIFYRFMERLNSTNTLPRMGRKFMEQVGEETKETVHLNIIDGAYRICIDSIESANPLKAGMAIGNRSPLHAGASAKCLLAFSSNTFQSDYTAKPRLTPMTGNTIVTPEKLIEELKQIQKQGYAQSLGERTSGLGSVSAPVFGPEKKILASLSLAIPEVRFSDRPHLAHCTKILTQKARSFSIAMGMQSDPR